MERKEALKRALKELIQARINLDHGQKNGVPPDQLEALQEKVAYRETVVDALRPVTIDREAWEPCECCKPSCKTCANAYAWDTHGKPDVCKKCLCFANFVADDNFCEKCGRPRTEEAWAMLEKWLRG